MTCDDGSEHETSDEHIFSLPEPKSELLPNVASPPTILAPPPAPTPPPLPGNVNPSVNPSHRPDLAAPPPTAGVKAGAHDAALPPPFAASRPPAGETPVQAWGGSVSQCGLEPHTKLGCLSGFLHHALPGCLAVWRLSRQMWNGVGA